MGNAVWLFLSLPLWYVPTILAPFAASYLTALPASGMVALLIGLPLAIYRFELNALWIIPSLLLSHLFVAVAGLMRGQIADPGPILIAFLVVQAGLVVLAAWRCLQSRPAGILLGWFAFTYALFAAFMAAMAFPDTWL